MKIRLLIADDHAVVRKGLITLLEDEADLEIVGEAVDGQDAVEKARALKPDIVLLDLTMPRMSGLEAAKLIADRQPAVRTLVFSMHNNQEYIVSAVENGAWGYLLKDNSREEILLAIHTVANGEKYFPPQISAVLAEALVNKNRPKKADKPEGGLGKLSRKERQILQFIVDGMNSREIAEKLILSVRTVSNHRANMLRKARVKNTVELVRMVVEEKGK
ncbi:MAG: response regulator transcription factor [Cytophagaceae bacterium]|nr:response regulator transcription factor [Cytophagaceae bacterium]